MRHSQKQQDLFHQFIQYADKLPSQGAFFPFYEFMDQQIRKSYNQIKKKPQKKWKELASFQQFWQELTNQDKVNVYCNWVLLLRKAIQLQKNPNIKTDQQSLTIQDQIYIRTTNIFQNWEKKIAKLTPTHLFITSGNKIRDHELKDYQIRKSRARDSFAWVLQSINNSAKTIHCKASSKSMFDEWFYALSVNIKNQKIQYFINFIRKQRLNPTIIKPLTNSGGSKQINIQTKKQKNEKQKTLTQLMIDKQMKSMDHENNSQIAQDDQDQFQSIGDNDQKKEDFDSLQKKQAAQFKKSKDQQFPDANPNIYKRLAPQYNYKSLLNFVDTPFNSALLYSDSEYRVYQLPQKGQEGIAILKMFTVFPFSKSLIFQAITAETMGWNDQIDVFTVKTKISSQNSALIYEKSKAIGLLYRQRDFLFLRHCFSVLNLKQKNTFMIDKSIDSIHHPPFMSVVRAEKNLIWGMIENQKQCILVVEGWIKGGGYMNEAQNKDMTLKYMKKINSLRGFLKQLSFGNLNSNNLFKQQWGIDIQKDDPISKGTIQQPLQVSQKQENNQSQQNKIKNDSQYKQQLEQFMIMTKAQSGQLNQQKQNNKKFIESQEFLQLQNYTPPQFDPNRFVKIPQLYIKKLHILVPKQKPTKPKLYPHIRGHHLWKGEWQISPAGGLAYIDEQKMNQQKKVLTYIIKRIGKNIFSGKGILNISLPVDIFSVESNIQRLAMSFGFFPFYLQKAAKIAQPHQQLKYVIGSAVAGSLIYMSIEKPFNPILGQTYQCWIDGCPVYFQQISHHPPIAAFMMKGRGYTVTGCVEAKIQLSINSGTGNNEGVFKVCFDNGNTIYYTTPCGCLSGLTYGQRKLNMVGKCYYWNQKGLFLQVNYNPASKSKGFFSGGKLQGDQKLPDYFQGVVKQYSPEAIKAIAFKSDQNNSLTAILPKNSPNSEPIKTYYKVHGRWNKYVKCNDQQIFDVDTTRYYSVSDQKYPLSSHCNYRQDIVYRRLRNYVSSQQFKQILEIKQRQDRKLRAKLGKSKKH